MCVAVALWARESTGGRAQVQVSSSGSLSICVYKVPGDADELTLKTADSESPFASSLCFLFPFVSCTNDNDVAAVN